MMTTKDAELLVVNALLIHVNTLDLTDFTPAEGKKIAKAQAKFYKRLTKFRDTLLKHTDGE